MSWTGGEYDGTPEEKSGPRGFVSGEFKTGCGLRARWSWGAKTGEYFAGVETPDDSADLFQNRLGVEPAYIYAMPTV